MSESKNRLSLHPEWKDLYDFFKGPDWPDCPEEKNFHLLPDWVQAELVAFGYSPNNLQNTNEIEEFVCRGKKPITVFFTMDTNGGGSFFGQDYISIIQKKYPGRKFPKVFEWCSGPGFIGFSILSHGLCDKLCLNDLYNPALELAELTAQHPENNCDGLVSIYLLKDISLLPTHEMFDLVVSNPPHYVKNISRLVNSNRLSTDIEWKSHKNFFSNIKSHLNPDGIILLQENYEGSSADDFAPFIKDAGLQITDCFRSSGTGNDPIYYLEIRSL
jgi:hypothetical protein